MEETKKLRLKEPFSLEQIRSGDLTQLWKMDQNVIVEFANGQMTSLGTIFHASSWANRCYHRFLRPRVGQHTCTPSACARSMILVRKVRLTWFHRFTGHATGTDWLEVPIPYIRPIFQAYVRGYTQKIWPNIWYSTSNLGSWNSHWSMVVDHISNRNGDIWPRGKAWKMVAISTVDTWIRQQCWQTPRRILTWWGSIYIYIYVIIIIY